MLSAKPRSRRKEKAKEPTYCHTFHLTCIVKHLALVTMKSFQFPLLFTEKKKKLLGLAVGFAQICHRYRLLVFIDMQGFVPGQRV